ncbi:solute carrier family 15 member 2-like isoform X2 [Gigantopelta aegis]|uniref:solute carrier family 15 member 2-like isoform X2 n=1 Tax=Gigantopelta aegis TaxID=1735272 RepID=UPI001B88DAA3|nr:solute carrier family 15 member 2-like isoform X2 [Gigantopelta aegis]XP_041374947.1 solute carrier family 15 member 2-like isoform X2 [Gigantopelta aegis]
MLGSEEEEDILFDMQTVREEDALLSSDGRPEKISGKAWGRVKNIFTRKSQYPASIYFILGTEFCERFCYYGLRAILVLYLTNWLGFSQNDGVALFHVTSMLAYFSPILGAIIADGYIGRYRTIMYLSIVYCIGNVILALTALPPKEKIGPIIGLMVIGLGTGGIKPCVSAFGGDQFPTEKEKERTTFFSAFYFIINLGSVLSTFITPVLRADVHCLEDTCYPLAFGIPGALMFIAVVIFVAGKKMYKVVPPKGNIIGKVVMCIWCGMTRKLFSSRERRDHWLDHADDKYEQNFIDDVKILCRVLFLFFPLPVFWALFDQQGSRWTLQAEHMDGNMGSLGRMKPDQMQVLNPLLILFLIPVFEHIVYPLLDRCKIPHRPLQRMTVGMIIGALSFIVAGMVQIKLDTNKEADLSHTQSGVTFINTMNCDTSIRSSILNTTLLSNQASNYTYIEAGNYSVSFTCKILEKTQHTKVYLEPQKSYRLVFMQTRNYHHVLKQFIDDRFKSKSGLAVISFISNLPYRNKTVSIKMVNSRFPDKEPIFKTLERFNATEFTEVEPGSYNFYIPEDQKGNTSWIQLKETVTLGTGAVYSLVIIKQDDTRWVDKKVDLNVYVSVYKNTISMFYLVPQYVVITIAEILFAITGLSFAYSQAPKGLKSVVQAAWLTTTAVGDLIVVIVAESEFLPSQSAEFFLFAVLMLVDTIIFAFLAKFSYEYITPRVTSSDNDMNNLVASDSLNEETQLKAQLKTQKEKEK